MCSKILNRDIKGNDDADDEEVFKPAPTCQEMLHALNILRQSVQHYGDNFQLQYKYEQHISSLINNISKQTKIDNFFPKLN